MSSDNIERVLKKPPHKSSDVIEMALTYPKLVEYLGYLKSVDETAFKHIKDIKQKLVVVDQNIEDIDECKLGIAKNTLSINDLNIAKNELLRRVEYCENQIRVYDTEINQIKNDKITHNNKMNSIQQESELLVKRLSDSNDRLSKFEFQYQLDRDKLNISLENMREEVNAELMPKIENTQIDISRLLGNFEKLSANFESLSEAGFNFKIFEEKTTKDISGIIEHHNTTKDTIATRFEDAEKSILSLIEKVNELNITNDFVSRQVDLANEKIGKTNERVETLEQYNSKRTMDEISSSQRNFKKEKESVREMRELKEERKHEREKTEQEKLREESINRLIEKDQIVEEDIENMKRDISEFKDNLRENVRITEDSSVEILELKREIEKLHKMLKFQDDQNKKFKKQVQDDIKTQVLLLQNINNSPKYLRRDSDINISNINTINTNINTNIDIEIDKVVVKSPERMNMSRKSTKSQKEDLLINQQDKIKEEHESETSSNMKKSRINEDIIVVEHTEINKSFHIDTKVESTENITTTQAEYVDKDEKKEKKDYKKPISAFDVKKVLQKTSEADSDEERVAREGEKNEEFGLNLKKASDLNISTEDQFYISSEENRHNAGRRKKKANKGSSKSKENEDDDDIIDEEEDEATYKNVRFKAKRKTVKKTLKVTRKKKRETSYKYDENEDDEKEVSQPGKNEVFHSTMEIQPVKVKRELSIHTTEDIHISHDISKANEKAEKEKDFENTKTLLINAVNTIKDSQQTLASNLNKKVNKTDFEKMQKEYEGNLTKAINDILEKISVLEKKLKKRTENYNMEKLYNDVGEENFKRSILQIIKSNIEKETPIVKLNETCQELKGSIAALDKRTSDINDTLLSTMVKEKQDINEIKSKMQDLSEELIDKTRLLEFKIKQIEGSDSVTGEEKEKEKETRFDDKQNLLNKTSKFIQQTDNNAPAKSLKDMIKNLTGNHKVIQDQLDKLQSKVESQSNDLFSRVKKDIGNDTIKHLESIKEDVKQELFLLDNKMEGKVDLKTTKELVETIKQAFLEELGKKIDRAELRSNNTQMKKKLDNLEVKISKTLVDTIIDLQLDEAPLIIKNNSNVYKGTKDKCMSCNQLIKDIEEANNSNFSEFLDNSRNINVNHEKKVFSLNKLNNTALKCGAGGYSRYLGNIETSINEELQNKNNSRNSTLADVVLNKETQRSDSNLLKKRDIFKKKKNEYYLGSSRIAEKLGNSSNVLLSDNTMANLLNDKDESNIVLTEGNIVPSSNKNLLGDLNRETIEKNIKVYLESELSNELGKFIIKPNNLLKTTDKAFSKASKKTNT